MKALVHTEPYKFEFKDVPQPRPGDEEILVLINLTNRISKVEVDVAATDYAQATDLLKNQPLPSSLSPGKFSRSLAAFDFVVAKRAPVKAP